MQNYSSFIQRSLPVIILFLLIPSFAQAHIISGETGLQHGLVHPLTGLDHILAMVAVGLWAAQIGGAAVWIVPITFVSVMLAGGALGMAHIELPLIEQGILASVFYPRPSDLHSGSFSSLHLRNHCWPLCNMPWLCAREGKCLLMHRDSPLP